MTRRIEVKGVRRRQISTDDLAYAYFLMGKQLVRERREREAKAKAKAKDRAQTPPRETQR
jgi:hypothetical protein